MTTISLALMFAAISHNLGLPPGLLTAVCEVESNYDPLAVHLDDNGSDSIGLCQLKLATAYLEGYRGTSEGLQRPAVNAFYSGRYLHRQLVRYHGDVHAAVSAYNAGHSSQHNPVYVRKVLNAWENYKQ